MQDEKTMPQRELALLAGIAAAVAALHLATNGRYGFHRDELQFLSDARHLDWGFVAYPPLTPAVERVSLALFGLSLEGLRLFSVLAQAAVIIISGLMARELGGGRLAQAAAATCVALSALPLFEGTEFQYSSFDYLWWVLAASCAVRLLRSGDARWWLGVGAALGLGLETKYSIVFFLAGIVCGMLFTSARRYFASPWFYAGAAVALMLFLPNLVWQARHHFLSVDFLRHIHARDVGRGRGDHFLREQFYLCANSFGTPLWIAGLIAYFRSPRLRMLGWMYLVPFSFFLLNHGRSYYVAATYPMLFAMGSVVAERRLATLPPRRRAVWVSIFFAGVALVGAFFIALLVPLATQGPVYRFALKSNGDLREEIGWPELVQRVAAVRATLPPGDVGIVTGNYGEQGAVEMLGPAVGLPPPISMTNSAWLRGYPVPQPETLIVLGFSRRAADKAFADCRSAPSVDVPAVPQVDNEESLYDIFVCGAPRLGWAEFWRQSQRFG